MLRRVSSSSARALRAPSRSLSSSSSSYSHIRASVEGRVGVVTLARPPVNALCDALIREVSAAMGEWDEDDSVGAILLTGEGSKAFAAGADIKEMAPRSFPDTYSRNMLMAWEGVARIRTPVVAAVNGLALGGGCELAMMADIIVCSDKAKFGQPEIRLGTIPGCGGTQRLTRTVGKAKAMEMCLTGDMIDAAEALQAGLVARVYPAAELQGEAMAMAAKIAAHSKPVAVMCKEAVNAALETTLAQGIMYEKRLFHSTFGTHDRKEGMAAFVAKRAPEWANK